MKKFLIVIALFVSVAALRAETPVLKTVLGKHFLVGCAVNTDIVSGYNPEKALLAAEQFNSIVAENCMKAEIIQPKEGFFFWDDADRTVAFAEKNGMTMIGHCLVWHSQAAEWMFVEEDGSEASREVLIDRMRKHIYALVGRYRGKIKSWDVVNEAINDDGSMRESKWYKIIGPEFIELAFRFAHEADPEAELYYNDYSMSIPAKRQAVCKLVRELKQKGCQIDGIGMQSHNGTDYPNFKETEKSIKAFANLGCTISLTEVDFNMLPNPKKFTGAEVSQDFSYSTNMDPYKNGMTPKGEKLFEKRYLDFFRLINKYSANIERVTFWGVTDQDSWLNDWPIRGRTNYPLLFDRNCKAKPVVKKIIKIFK